MPTRYFNCSISQANIGRCKHTRTFLPTRYPFTTPGLRVANKDCCLVEGRWCCDWDSNPEPCGAQSGNLFNLFTRTLYLDLHTLFDKKKQEYTYVALCCRTTFGWWRTVGLMKSGPVPKHLPSTCSKSQPETMSLPHSPRNSDGLQEELRLLNPC